MAETWCDKYRCFVGYVYDYSDSGLFNGWDIFHAEASFPERVKNDQLHVWLFKFCPECGRPIDRNAIADKLGRSLNDCGAA